MRGGIEARVIREDLRQIRSGDAEPSTLCESMRKPIEWMVKSGFTPAWNENQKL